jgi:hypothetical protein
MKDCAYRKIDAPPDVEGTPVGRRLPTYELLTPLTKSENARREFRAAIAAQARVAAVPVVTHWW